MASTYPVVSPGRRPRCLPVNFLRPLAAFAAVVIPFLIAGSARAASKLPWDPIPPADLSAKDSTSSPGIGSEILFSRESLEEDEYGLEAENYVRAKIYTQGGVDRSNLLRIQFNSWMKISKLTARVVKPNGSAIELTKADFHESTVVKDNHSGDLKQIAFAFPHLEPGDIVEYRWLTTADNWITFWTYCQEEIPVREFKLTMDAANGAIISWQNCPQAETIGLGTDKIGVTLRNLPAFLAEPYMPPERDLRGWIRLLYRQNDETPEERWMNTGKGKATAFSDKTKPKSALTKKATELIAGAANDDEKLRRLYNFCRTEIVNYTWDDSPEILKQKDKLLKSDFQTSVETLARRKGNYQEVDFLFAGLARAAGFEVRRAINADRDTLINVHMRDGFEYMDHDSIAVKRGDDWQFFNPGYFAVPFGMERRNSEGAEAFVCDEKGSHFVKIPTSTAESSAVQHKGRFRLDEDGNLEGEVEETFTGHLAEEEKELYWKSPVADLEKDLKESVNARLPTADLSEIHWENLRACDLPAIRRYKVQVPGYAQKVGSRLVWPTNYFEVGTTAAFPEGQRRTAILFPFSWTEHDDIEITIPDGFELDRPSAPANVRSPKDPVHATFNVAYQAKRHVLAYRRDCVIGADAQSFTAASYGWIKQTFDSLHRGETHTLVLKPKVIAAATSPAISDPKKSTPTAP